MKQCSRRWTLRVDTGGECIHARLFSSPMYHTAKRNNWALPSTYEGYAFLSYESEPLQTKFLSAAEVLKFRDVLGTLTSPTTIT